MFNISSSATVTISGLVINGGRLYAEAKGGGILNAGILTLTNCTVLRNNVFGGAGDNASGGGIYNSGILTLVNCLIASNSVMGGFGGGSGLGGAIYSSGQLTLVNCLIENNSALGGQGQAAGGYGLGGGICVQSTTSQVALTNCTFSGNSATGGDGVTAGFGGGGGLYISGSSFNDYSFIAGSMVNCTIASNTAMGGTANNNIETDTAGAGEGGGVYVVSPRLSIICCTISGNTSIGGDSDDNGGDGLGGGIHVDSLYLPWLGNTIVGGNGVVAGISIRSLGPDGSTMGYDVDGTVTSGGFNLIGVVDENNGWIASDRIPSNDTNTPYLDAKLGPLQDNGGPTPTMALLLTSPAIDQGTNFGINTDQRGQLRPNDYLNIPNALGGDGSDIGAFELYPGQPHLKIHFYPTNSVPSPNNGYSGVVYVSHANNSPGMGALRNQPIFLWQTISALTVSNNPGGNQWSVFKGHVRLINDNWVARDPVIAGSAFYGLFNLTNNSFLTNAVYPPDITLSASNIMSASATLNGSAVPSEANTVYWFEYGTDTNNYAGMTQPTPLATSDNTAILNCSVVGLSPSTFYHYQLVVTNDWSIDTGPELGGDQTFTTLDPVPLVSTQPASFITTNSAQLNGIINPEGPGADNAYFEYGLDTNEQDLTQSPLFFPSGNSTQNYSYNATGLAPGTTYYYRFAAYNNTQAGYGAFLTVTSAAVVVQPPPPTAQTVAATNVRLISGYTYSAQFNATVNPNGVDTMVYFQYGVSQGSLGFTTPAYDIGSGTTPTSYNFTVNTLNQLTSSTYYFQIVATNSIAVTNGAILSFPLQ
jgi:hypothetical protein